MTGFLRPAVQKLQETSGAWWVFDRWSSLVWDVPLQAPQALSAYLSVFT